MCNIYKLGSAYCIVRVDFFMLLSCHLTTLIKIYMIKKIKKKTKNKRWIEEQISPKTLISQ